MVIKQLKNGTQIMSLAASGGTGRTRLRSNLFASEIRPDEGLSARLKAAGAASMFFDVNVPAQTKQDNFNYGQIGDVLPQDGDFITVPFRAISKTLVEGHWLDFTRDNVLEASVPMLMGATVYPNHDLFDINNALGVVSNVTWDAAGTAANGVPGINADYKIDALMNPRIARLLLMKPPAIHSTSMTVLFDFEFSHLDLVEQRRFWDLLGEEVDGSIVRLIVTEILEYWEASLVFQGADRLAKMIDDGEEDTTDFADMSLSGDPDTAGAELDAGKGARVPATPPNLNEEKTMKLTSEQKAKLGIEFDGEDVPESELLKAGESLADKVTELTESTAATELEAFKAKAAQADALITEKRVEVKRLATIAELGGAEGDLPKVVADDIAGASVERLTELHRYYEPKAAAKLKRSSDEGSDEVEAAAGLTKQQTVPAIGLH